MAEIRQFLWMRHLRSENSMQALGDQRRRVPGPLTDACDPEAVIARLAGC